MQSKARGSRGCGETSTMGVWVQAVHVCDIHVHSVEHDALAGLCQVGVDCHCTHNQVRIPHLGAHLQVVLGWSYAGG